jgi:hypothetical protein
MSKVWVIAKRSFGHGDTQGIPLCRCRNAIAVCSHLWHQLSHEWQPGTIHQIGLEPIAVVDRSHTLDFELAASLEPARESPTAATEVLQKAAGSRPSGIVPYTDMTAAIRDLKDGKLSAVYLIESDYMSTGKIVAYSPERGIFSELATPDRSRLYDLIRASLVKGHIDAETRERVLAPGRLKQMKVSKQGDVENASDPFQKAARFFGPFSMFLLLTMSIFFSSVTCCRALQRRSKTG